MPATMQSATHTDNHFSKKPIPPAGSVDFVFGGDDVVGSVVIAAAGDQPVFDSRAWSAWI
jgi:hypothetical protein